MIRETLACSLLLAAGCSTGPTCTGDLSQRAYVVSKNSDEVHVIDLSCMQVLGEVHTGGQALHMLELNQMGDEAFVDSEATGETVVFDTRTLTVTKRLVTGNHPTHETRSHDGKLIAVVAEQDDAVRFIDTATDEVVATVTGFHTPHFPRWSKDDSKIYVANIGGYAIARIDRATLAVDKLIALDGHAADELAPGESGFADAQIDASGILWAAHAATGRVLVYDTVADLKLPELTVGARPWIVYAEHPFANLSHHLVPNFGDQTASLLRREPRAVDGVVPADSQSYGVNYSPLAPDRAYVMNRVRQEIAVVDVTTAAQVSAIPVGGNTETASTTADGKYIVAAVSSANRVVVIDAASGQVSHVFEHIGAYPWSVTIPGGQNYCH
jgi:DNA-binding beta-propeller fold protein YncE